MLGKLALGELDWANLDWAKDHSIPTMHVRQPVHQLRIPTVLKLEQRLLHI